MAVTRGENVIVLGADNDSVKGRLNITSVKAFDTSSGSNLIQLKKSDTDGVVLWQHTLSSDAYQHDHVDIIIGAGETLHVDMGNTGIVWLYTI